MDSTKLVEIAESLDRLCNMDISGRGVIRTLFAAARANSEKPLTLAAAERLCETVKPGDPVIIATGWIDQPLAAPDRGETDGPPGALALARALRVGLKAMPIILVDECLVDGMVQVARAAGFHTVPVESLKHSIELNKLQTLAILSLPVDHAQAKAEAKELIERIRPTACIAIERGGMNEAGRIHNMSGFDTSATQAKMDYVFIEAGKRKILTVGIGDGGNEIGMANIAPAIREQLPYGQKCQCPCGLGLAPTTPVDVLLTATVSNWGGYALAAQIAAITGQAGAMNTPEREQAVLTAAAGADFHDAIYGSIALSVDGLTLDVHQSMITMMREVVRQKAQI